MLINRLNIDIVVVVVSAILRFRNLSNFHSNRFLSKKNWTSPNWTHSKLIHHGVWMDYFLGVQREGRETRRGNSCGRLNTFERKSSHGRDDGLDLAPIKRRRSTTQESAWTGTRHIEMSRSTYGRVIKRVTRPRRRLNAVNPVARSASGNFFLFPPPTRSLHSFHVSFLQNWTNRRNKLIKDSRFISPLVLESFYHNTTIRIWKTISPSHSSFPFHSFFPRLFLPSATRVHYPGAGDERVRL